jgi:CBS domain-containing protein
VSLPTKLRSERLGLSHDVTRLLTALAFVALGLLIIWFTKAVIGVTGDGLFVAELFVVILVFLILSGQISELTAGGVTAKFRDVAANPVAIERQVVTPEEAQMVPKGGLDALRMLQERGLDENRPLILTLKVGGDRAARTRATGRYSPSALRQYVHALEGLSRFYFVAFVGPDGRLIGYLPRRRFQRALEGAEGQALVRAVNAGNVEAVRSFPGVMTATVAAGTSNAEALEYLTRLGFPELIGIDEEGRPAGVIEREQLATQMLLAIARP